MGIQKSLPRKIFALKNLLHFYAYLIVYGSWILKLDEFFNRRLPKKLNVSKNMTKNWTKFFTKVLHLKQRELRRFFGGNTPKNMLQSVVFVISPASRR
jgi:hypothetical protein